MTLARPPLVAFEHVRIQEGIHETEIAPSEIDAVMRLQTRYRGLCKRGHRSLQMRQYAGLVNLGTRVLEILPKIDQASHEAASGRTTLLWLLRHSGAALTRVRTSAGQEFKANGLMQLLIEVFLAEVDVLRRRGLLHS